VTIGEGAEVSPDATITGPVMVGDAGLIAAGATVGPRAVLGESCEVAGGATVTGSVLLDGCRIGGGGGGGRSALSAPPEGAPEAAPGAGSVVGEDELVGAGVGARCSGGFGRSRTTFATPSGGSRAPGWGRWRRRPRSSAAWAGPRSAAIWRRRRSATASR